MNLCESSQHKLYRLATGWLTGSNPMTREEKAKFVAQCRELVMTMGRLETTVGRLDERLTKAEQRSALNEVLEWLGSTPELARNPYTREWAREMLAQVAALAAYDTFEGSPDSYIV